MAAPIGNSFWKMRSKHGRNPIFPDPETLWEACVEYFEWVDANPLTEGQAFSYQGEAKIADVPKMRAMTIAGLCIFLDIQQTTWNDYGDRDGFSSVTTRVNAIIRTQKFEGAAAGLLNPNIIARDLGLAEKSELTGKDGAPLVPEIDQSRLARATAVILARGVKAKGKARDARNG